MTYSIGHFINGKPVVSGDRLQPVYNPATGQIIGETFFATPTDVLAAIAAARTAFLSWSTTSPRERAQIMFVFRNLLAQHTDEIAELITRENGKTLKDAKGSMARGVELVDFFCGIPQLLLGSYAQQVASDLDSYSIRQPIGVAVGISPFNFPVMVPIWMFIPAIACGNTFILKPSEKAPSASLRLAELFKEAGLPDGVFNVLNGDQDIVQQLITHPNVDLVSCVGSTPVAESIYHTAISHGKRAHTFGGAKNHCMVMPDANLEWAASAIAGAAYGSAGERCMAISVVLAITDQVADDLINRLSEHAKNLVIAPGTNARSEMGPLITQEHLERVKNDINLGVFEGATLVVDGRDFHLSDYPQGFFLGANLFDHVQPEMKIYQKEIFGPVLLVLRIPSFEAGLNLINEHCYGNSAVIFTQNGGIAHEFARSVKAGMVGINVPIPVPAAYQSFGGWKRSLFGDIHMHAKEAIIFHTKAKTIMQRWPSIIEDAQYYMSQSS